MRKTRGYHFQPLVQVAQLTTQVLQVTQILAAQKPVTLTQIQAEGTTLGQQAFYQVRRMMIDTHKM